MSDIIEESGMYMLEETTATSEIKAMPSDILRDMEEYNKSLAKHDVREIKKSGTSKHIQLVCGEHYLPVSIFGNIFHSFRDRPLRKEKITDKDGIVYEVKDIIISETENGSILYKYVLKMEES